MTQPMQSRLATQEMVGRSPVVRLKPGMHGEIRVILASARVEESENRERVMGRAPEAQPGEWTMTRLMLERLERDGEIDFYDFSVTERRIYNEFGRVVVEDYTAAIKRCLAHLELTLVETTA